MLDIRKCDIRTKTGKHAIQIITMIGSCYDVWLNDRVATYPYMYYPTNDCVTYVISRWLFSEFIDEFFGK